MIKKKLSILLTLALATIITTGCDELDAFLSAKGKNPSEQTEQHEEAKEEQQSENVKVRSVRLQEPDKTLEVDDVYQIFASVLPAEANQEVSYESTKPNVCSVSDTGLVTALASGTAAIKVTSVEDNTKHCELHITVNEKMPDNPPPVDPPATNYTVSFNANGGTGTMISQETNGSNYIVPACTFEYANHSFVEWALNGTDGTKYIVGSEIQNISSNITLFAIWKENTTPTVNYTVTFNANGGTGSMASQQTKGDSFVVPTCTFTRDNYSFKNWAYESKNGVEYAPGETIVNISKNITLYALWNANQTPPDQPQSDYYSGISSNLSGAALKTALNNLIKITKAGWDYDGLYEAYKTTDVRPDGKHLWDIYADSTDYTLNDSRINKNYSAEGDSLNREHMIPQSFFSEGSPMKSDIHHVLPSDGYVNNRRSNFPHGIVTGTPTYTSNDGCKLGSDRNGNTVFEPMNHYKGDIARIYFYFATCYEDRIPNFKKTFDGMDKNTYPTIKDKYIDIYLQWSIDDPVSTKETDRNDAIYAVQKNRNPFVDHPEYACRIWGTRNAATKSICGVN